jgi:hypothetical protein
LYTAADVFEEADKPAKKTYFSGLENPNAFRSSCGFEEIGKIPRKIESKYIEVSIPAGYLRSELKIIEAVIKIATRLLENGIGFHRSFRK